MCCYGIDPIVRIARCPVSTNESPVSGVISTNESSVSGVIWTNERAPRFMLPSPGGGRISLSHTQCWLPLPPGWEEETCPATLQHLQLNLQSPLLRSEHGQQITTEDYSAKFSLPLPLFGLNLDTQGLLSRPIRLALPLVDLRREGSK